MCKAAVGTVLSDTQTAVHAVFPENILVAIDDSAVLFHHQKSKILTNIKCHHTAYQLAFF